MDNLKEWNWAQALHKHLMSNISKSASFAIHRGSGADRGGGFLCGPARILQICMYEAFKLWLENAAITSQPRFTRWLGIVKLSNFAPQQSCSLRKTKEVEVLMSYLNVRTMRHEYDGVSSFGQSEVNENLIHNTFYTHTVKFVIASL